MADKLENAAVAEDDNSVVCKNGRKMTDNLNSSAVKIENDDVEDANDNCEVDDNTEEDVPRLGPAALGLQRVGSQIVAHKPVSPIITQPSPTLNARGMPARIRKKNRLFFDDDIVNTPHHRVPSAKKAKSSPIKKYSKNVPQRISKPPMNRRELFRPKIQLQPILSPDRKVGQKIGLRLRNLLKLPKAHKWVCYEWFYSNVDKCLFDGDNDFNICLKESLPELKCRELTRVQWTKIRKMMGKPRRCSQAFFAEERLDLEKKRNKIRAIQQRKATDLSSFKDLPPEIPMQLVIGTKVTARLRKPQDGLFNGSIDAVDTSNNTYRITFERHGLGTHSVPDYEVLSNEPPDTISLSNFTRHKYRHRNGVSPYSGKYSPFLNSKLKKDPLLSGLAGNHRQLVLNSDSQQIGSFPAKLLEKIVLVTKILTAKKCRIEELSQMNSKAERYKSFDLDLPDEFERKYAGLLIDLEKLNYDLQRYLDDIQGLCVEIAPEPSVAAMLAPSHLREKCRDQASDIVQKQNCIMSAEKSPINNQSVLDLITDLTALMLQVQSLSISDKNAYELQVLQGTMEQIKSKLSPSNQSVFQNYVEIHMKHIQMDLGQNIDKIVINGVAKI